MESIRQSLLLASLDCAVPLWIEELRSVSLGELIESSRGISQVIAEKGDIIQYRSDVRGETANAFNQLARGLAVLSFMPGGVKFLGRHWVAIHGDRGEYIARC